MFEIWEKKEKSPDIVKSCKLSLLSKIITIPWKEIQWKRIIRDVIVYTKNYCYTIIKSKRLSKEKRIIIFCDLLI